MSSTNVVSIVSVYSVYISIQGVSVKRFRTSMRGRVQPDDSKSYRNAGSECFSGAVDVIARKFRVFV